MAEKNAQKTVQTELDNQLIDAAVKGDITAIKDLLSKGANPLSEDNEHRRASYFAYRNGHNAAHKLITQAEQKAEMAKLPDAGDDKHRQFSAKIAPFLHVIGLQLNKKGANQRQRV